MRMQFALLNDQEVNMHGPFRESGFLSVRAGQKWTSFLNEENEVGQTSPGEGHYVSFHCVVSKSRERERLERSSINTLNLIQVSWVQFPGEIRKLSYKKLHWPLYEKKREREREKLFGKMEMNWIKFIKREFRQTHLRDVSQVLP